MAGYDEVIKLLPKLTPEELQKVHVRVKGYLSVAGGATGRVTSDTPNFHNNDHDWLMDGIYSELRRRGLLGEKQRLPKSVIPSTYEAKAAGVRMLLLSYQKDKSGRLCAALGQTAARALAEYIELDLKFTVSPKMMFMLVDKIPVALDTAFPGYLTAGLLPFCWGAWVNEEAARG